MIERINFRKYKDGGFISLNNRFFADLDTRGSLHIYKNGKKKESVHIIKCPSFRNDADSFTVYM